MIRWICLLLLLVPLSVLANTSFTYQGQLMDGGQPFSGEVDIEYALYASDSGGSAVRSGRRSVQVSDGLFQLEIDFGTPAYESGLWLELTVDGQTLDPRQPITAAPLAIRSLDAGGGSQWVDEGSGISYQGGNVAVGHPATGNPQTLSVRSESGEDPFSVLNQTGIRTLHAQNNAGITVGGFFLAPDNGLMVHGDAAQERTSYGFAKVGAVIECGDQGGGVPGSIVRGFNNVPSANPPGVLEYLPAQDSVGNCQVELGFPLTDSIIVAMGGSFSGRNVECGVSQTTRLRCRVRDLTGNEFSARINVVVF